MVVLIGGFDWVIEKMLFPPSATGKPGGNSSVISKREGITSNLSAIIVISLCTYRSIVKNHTQMQFLSFSTSFEKMLHDYQDS